MSYFGQSNQTGPLLLMLSMNDELRERRESLGRTNCAQLDCRWVLLSISRMPPQKDGDTTGFFSFPSVAYPKQMLVDQLSSLLYHLSVSNRFKEACIYVMEHGVIVPLIQK